MEIEIRATLDNYEKATNNLLDDALNKLSPKEFNHLLNRVEDAVQTYREDTE